MVFILCYFYCNWLLTSLFGGEMSSFGTMMKRSYFTQRIKAFACSSEGTYGHFQLIFIDCLISLEQGNSPTLQIFNLLVVKDVAIISFRNSSDNSLISLILFPDLSNFPISTKSYILIVSSNFSSPSPFPTSTLRELHLPSKGVMQISQPWYCSFCWLTNRSIFIKLQQSPILYMFISLKRIHCQKSIRNGSLSALLVDLAHWMHLLGVLAPHAACVPLSLHPGNVLVLEEETVGLLTLAVLAFDLLLGQGLQLHLSQ